MIFRAFVAVALFLCALNAAPYKFYGHEVMPKKDAGVVLTSAVYSAPRTSFWRMRGSICQASLSNKKCAFRDLKTLEKVFHF